MKLHRIYGVILKSFYITKRSPDRWADLFYWAAIDLLIWGLTSSYFTSFAPKSHILPIIISGILFWIIVWRAQQEISVNLLEDLWNKNLVNIFATPFTFGEWIFSFLLVSFIKGGISFAVACVIAYFLYGVNVLNYGAYLIPFIVILLLTAWGIGFFITGAILRYGQKVQNLAWSLVSILAPFSAIYYPLSVLPHWAQTIAKIFPTSYIFDGIHHVITSGTTDISSLVIGFSLSLVYLVGGLWYIHSCFRTLLQKGLINL